MIRLGSVLHASWSTVKFLTFLVFVKKRVHFNSHSQNSQEWKVHWSLCCLLLLFLLVYFLFGAKNSDIFESPPKVIVFDFASFFFNYTITRTTVILVGFEFEFIGLHNLIRSKTTPLLYTYKYIYSVRYNVFLMLRFHYSVLHLSLYRLRDSLCNNHKQISNVY